MRKRIRFITIILMLAMLSLAVRTFYISFYQTQSASISGSSHAEYYGTNRGLIFDCKETPLVETQTARLSSVINPAFSFDVPQRYADNQLCEHIIGYTDAEQNGVSGIEKDYNDYLKSIPNQIAVKTYQDARGRLLKGKGTVADTTALCKDSGVVLCIEKEIQQAVEMAGNSLNTGAIIVMDSESGKIRALASFPRFEPRNIQSALSDTRSPLINRALCAYNIGSVFKVVVCLAALEEGIGSDFSYTCTGNTTCSGTVFHCLKEGGHGKLDMKSAIAYSCNTYFIALAQKVGVQKIIEICNRLGIEEAEKLSDSIIASAGNVPEVEQVNSTAALANLSFGQGELLASPLWLCKLYASIHNGGFLPEGQLVEGISNHGKIQAENSKRTQVFENAHTQTVLELLHYAVSNGTGKGAKLKNVDIAGKTATAQTGKYENNKEVLISYFIGLFSIKSDKFTVLVMCENGTSGSENCVPVFKEICQRIVSLKDREE